MHQLVIRLQLLRFLWCLFEPYVEILCDNHWDIIQNFAFGKLWERFLSCKCLPDSWKHWWIDIEEDIFWKLHNDSEDSLFLCCWLVEYVCSELINENVDSILECKLHEMIIADELISNAVLVNINSNHSFNMVQYWWELILRVNSMSLTVWNVCFLIQFSLWGIVDGWTILLVHILDQVKK